MYFKFLRIRGTIKLEFQAKIKAKILELLSSFSSDELEIVQNLLILMIIRELDTSLAKIKNGTAECCSLEELDIFLEKTISEYEN